MHAPDPTSRPCIYGEALFDCFPDGAEVLGGAPFNVAWHLQAFGCAPLFISRVGNDKAGEKIRTCMQQWGMSTGGLQTDYRYPTGKVNISLVNGEPTFDIVADCAYDHIAANELPDIKPGLIYHGSLAVRERESRDTLNILKQATRAPVFVDINLREPWWRVNEALELLQTARWTKLNNHEVSELSDAVGDLEKQALRIKKQCGLELVIVTRGKKGAFVLAAKDENPIEIIPASEENIVDTVGAGDAFASVCILGLLNGWDMHTMLERAQQFASAILGLRGATTDNMEFYKPFIHLWGLSLNETSLKQESDK